MLLELVDEEVYPPIVFGNPNGSQRQKRVPSKDSRESFDLIYTECDATRQESCKEALLSIRLE